jgi:hypothetical protein
MKNFSDMIGIVPERILEYVHHVEEKEMTKSGRSEIVKKNSKSLALFTKNELKLCLERENVNFTREQYSSILSGTIPIMSLKFFISELFSTLG